MSEPASEYIRFEYDVTETHNAATGEQGRWPPRRRSTGLRANATIIERLS